MFPESEAKCPGQGGNNANFEVRPERFRDEADKFVKPACLPAGIDNQ